MFLFKFKAHKFVRDVYFFINFIILKILKDYKKIIKVFNKHPNMTNFSALNLIP